MVTETSNIKICSLRSHPQRNHLKKIRRSVQCTQSTYKLNDPAIAKGILLVEKDSSQTSTMSTKAIIFKRNIIRKNRLDIFKIFTKILKISEDLSSLIQYILLSSKNINFLAFNEGFTKPLLGLF